MDILKAVHLKKYYGSGENLVKAVDDVSFGIEKGSFTAIVGTGLCGCGGGHHRRTFDHGDVEGGADGVSAPEYRFCLPEL